VNRARRLRGLPEANMLLTRGPGISRPPPEGAADAFQRSTVIIADHPIEVGVARYVGATVVEYSAGDLRELVRCGLAQISQEDPPNLVVVHVKGPDEFGHDRDGVGKARSLTMIDRDVVRDLSAAFIAAGYRLIVTSDHATPCRIGTHTDAPVPFLVAGHGVGPAPAAAFNERAIHAIQRGEPELGSRLLRVVANAVE
jgi:2,3-bisphosphoglycerate-independent phosphoglycerate mutase